MKIKFIPLIVVGVLLIACKKEGCMDKYAVNYDVHAEKGNEQFCLFKKPKTCNYIPIFGKNSATLVSLDLGYFYNKTKMGNYYSWSSIYFAKFSEDGGNMVSAGNINFSISTELNGVNPFYYNLSKSSNNSYSHQYFNNGGVPVPLPDTIRWQGTGNVWPAFNLNTSNGFSGTSKLQSGNPKISSSYTFKVSSMSNADSLVLQIFGQAKSITKVIPASATSQVFSQSEIKSLGKGKAYLRVVSIRYDKQIVGGRTYYFLNAKRSGKKVSIGD